MAEARQSKHGTGKMLIVNSSWKEIYAAAGLSIGKYVGRCSWHYRAKDTSGCSLTRCFLFIS